MARKPKDAAVDRFAQYQPMAVVDRFEPDAVKAWSLAEIVNALRDSVDVVTSRRRACFCMSTEGDLLSQWRGYADDGYGFSIGFDAAEIRECGYALSGELVRVIYDEAEQKETIRPLVRTLRQHANAPEAEQFWLSGALPYGDEWLALSSEKQTAAAAISSLIWDLHFHLFAMKGWAFREEMEWRLVAAFEKPDGFHPKRDRLVPYLEAPIGGAHQTNRLIKKVILGPRNRTPPSLVQQMLRPLGEIEVENSSATYT